MIAHASGIRQEDGSLPGEPLALVEGLIWFLIAPVLISGLVWVLVSGSHRRYASPQAKARKDSTTSEKRDLLTSID